MEGKAELVYQLVMPEEADAEKGLASLNDGERQAWRTAVRRPNPDGVNDREFPNRQDRIASQFVLTRGAWVSESRVGWNKADLARLDRFLSVIGPNQPAEVMPYGRRAPSFGVSATVIATPAAPTPTARMPTQSASGWCRTWDAPGSCGSPSPSPPSPARRTG